MREHANDPRVKIEVIDNSDGQGQAKAVGNPFAFLSKKVYNKDRVTKQVYEELETQFRAGKISEEVYRATKSISGGAIETAQRAGQPIGRGDGRRVETFLAGAGTEAPKGVTPPIGKPPIGRPAEGGFMLPEKVGNIRLSKLAIPDELKLEIIEIVKENNDFIAQRRGVVTFADTEALAQSVRLPKKVLPGRASSAEESQALGNQVSYTRTRLDDVARKIKLGDNSDLMLAEYTKMHTQLGSLLEMYAGKSAIASRLLQKSRFELPDSKPRAFIHATRSVANPCRINLWRAFLLR